MPAFFVLRIIRIFVETRSLRIEGMRCDIDEAGLAIGRGKGPSGHWRRILAR